ncbi:PREDICTED: uncharacterized protein LOC109216993 [Nicotiana attenuata]|uniref:Uncharacterized protein n=1 Tax=Nicotiana attenuata TaxID=49451 RepID=A0A1J6K2P0_NICAT|nr:PREDICTED: uncharacterized protein LOC109216993 [Nicotiana attenuata]XP_019236763.1 PREDICTED: uncharacterized protein LOC109216993 [Nicotiana attenuata]OIT22892.1 hypothetical protein A4A49_34333 [Nicotiana attenuata]
MLGQAQQQTVEQNDDITELEEAGILVEEVELLEEEVELLEEEVKQKAERIAEYRGRILAQLESDLSSIFAAQRPVLGTRFDNGSVFQPGSSSDPCSSDVGGPTDIAMLAGEERKEAEKIQLLKKKNLESASAIPVALNRMKDCMARIDKLQSCNGVVHPTFKRKRSC